MLISKPRALNAYSGKNTKISRIKIPGAEPEDGADLLQGLPDARDVVRDRGDAPALARRRRRRHRVDAPREPKAPARTTVRSERRAPAEDSSVGFVNL